jgi:thiamine biosynthesis protein ThiS
MQITLNGEPYQLEQPLSVTELLEKLDIDSRRVAIEYNLSILKRYAYPQTMISEGDRLEIVNAVGGG